MKIPHLIFLTGSSGAGKTTLLSNYKKNYPSSDNEYLHFDSVGVPTTEEMVRLFGSPEKWQRTITKNWIEIISTKYREKKLVIIEGQVRPLFIIEACSEHNLSNYQIILVHCNKAIRNERLIFNRNQPELANDDMENWSNFLKAQAENLNIPIIDTSAGSLKSAVKNIHDLILRGRS